MAHVFTFSLPEEEIEKLEKQGIDRHDIVKLVKEYLQRIAENANDVAIVAFEKGRITGFRSLKSLEGFSESVKEGGLEKVLEEMELYWQGKATVKSSE